MTTEHGMRGAKAQESAQELVRFRRACSKSACHDSAHVMTAVLGSTGVQSIRVQGDGGQDRVRTQGKHAREAC